MVEQGNDFIEAFILESSTFDDQEDRGPHREPDPLCSELLRQVLIIQVDPGYLDLLPDYFLLLFVLLRIAKLGLALDFLEQVVQQRLGLTASLAS